MAKKRLITINSPLGRIAVERDHQPHRLLRETYRHYYEFKQIVASGGKGTISYAIRGSSVDDGNTLTVPFSVSFFDLKEGLKPQSEGGPLSDRKLQAVMLNVVRDLKQREVADIMEITTVSVGQYVEHAMLQLAHSYFPEFYEEKVAV